MDAKRIPVSPLRYPGSKARFYKQFRQFFCQLNLVGRKIVEPYAGSASISISLLAEDLVPSALLVERDPLIFSFWHSVFFNTDEFIAAINDISVDMSSWNVMRKHLQVTVPEENRTVELGLAGLFLNRTNFSGVLHAGPIGGVMQSSRYFVGCRFNKSDIADRIREISKLRDRIEVKFGDAIDHLNAPSTKSLDDALYYIDPPYFKEGKKLYRHCYNIGDHAELARILTKASFNWILSYDAHHVIEHLYENFTRIDQIFRYSSKGPKQGRELLITNMSLNNDPNERARIDCSKSKIPLAVQSKTVPTV